MVMKTYECLLTCASLPHSASPLPSPPPPYPCSSPPNFSTTFNSFLLSATTPPSSAATQDGGQPLLTHTHTSSLGVYTHKKRSRNDRILELFVPPSLVWTMQLVVQLLTTLPPHMGCGTWRLFSPGWTTVNRSSAQLTRQGSGPTSQLLVC